MKATPKTALRILSLIILISLALQACNLPIPTAESEPAAENPPVNSSTPHSTSSDGGIETTEADDLAADEPSQEDGVAPDKNQNSIADTDELTEEEVAGLLYMREEEKLAHDVYMAMFEIWNLPIFENIAGSEQSHTDAVKKLLDLFELPDPAKTSPAGVFVDDDLQNLYDSLTAQGAQSLNDALKVGAVIEEIDILDLQAALEEANNDSIIRVYENLLRGSTNHLRAFTSTLASQTGETYQPQYMSETAYKAIIDGDSTRGDRRNGRNGSGNRP